MPHPSIFTYTFTVHKVLLMRMVTLTTLLMSNGCKMLLFVVGQVCMEKNTDLVSIAKCDETYRPIPKETRGVSRV